MYILEGYPTVGDERVAERCAQARAARRQGCLALAEVGCAWNATAHTCAEQRRSPSPMEATGELYSALAAGAQGTILYRPCDDLHGRACVVGGVPPSCHGLMDNRTLWENARELNAIAAQALQLLSFATPVPNASQSNVSSDRLHHDVFL
eukprot:COSAG01_NODE_9588_length_2399_cov_16.890870_3_plen_149_part_01